MEQREVHTDDNQLADKTGSQPPASPSGVCPSSLEIYENHPSHPNQDDVGQQNGKMGLSRIPENGVVI